MDILLVALFFALCTILATHRGFGIRGSCAVFVFYMLLGTGAGIFEEKSRMSYAVGRAAALVEEYSAEQEQLAQDVLMRAGPQAAGSRAIVGEVLALVQTAPREKLGQELIATLARSVPQLSEAERSQEIVRVIERSSERQAFFKNEHLRLLKQYPELGWFHAKVYWSVEDALGISSTLPRALPHWPEQEATTVDVTFGQ